MTDATRPDETADEPADQTHRQTGPGALTGLKVVDLTRVLGGPFCTQWLGDHGAEVVKVEPPQGDETRAWGPPFKDDAASYFIGVNRSKRGISLDLSRPEGRAVLLRLLEQADVLIENFRTGTLEKWGIGYEQFLKARFPRLVHCRISGFGADGPLGGFPGYDAVVQAYSGLMSVNGDQTTGPLRLGVPMVDIATGMSAAFGIMAALYERARSGEGQFLEVSLYDTAISLVYPHGANYLLSGKPPRRWGNPHPNVCPYDKFSARDGELFLGVGNDGQFAKLCAALADPEMAADPRFRSNSDRLANREALRERLEALLAEHDAEPVCRMLMERGVPAGPVNELPAVVAHPHTRHRNMIVEIDDYRGVGNPVKLQRTPARFERKPPHFSQDTRAVLGEAGYSAAEIDALIEAGVVPRDKAEAAAD
ncbi:formyl-CoA transferase [Tistlia consotensis]|uniref:Formyl-CoA transferase n=1 Tax=Tistlia consotensis USBA 355 TaxID=560819 RepID=A0A1Y6BV74_9PROT|nr:CoA transferase [Tistlia consotensis]SMF30188.1 formyl-CoA transferase [Tistlia consotensis USBA 355]SNR90321.1 formyl-CoA transferase [Tistlia consotensis]